MTPDPFLDLKWLPRKSNPFSIRPMNVLSVGERGKAFGRLALTAEAL